MNNPEKKVKFVFYCQEKESADLKVRLLYDGLTQSAFFRALLQKYINKDSAMMHLVETIKIENKTMGARKAKRASAQIEEGNKLMQELGITESDKQKIFDIIEMEIGDYE